MCKGTTNGTRWNKTPNGWPNYETMMVWGHMMVEHKAAQKLEKMIIFCDNADVHMNLELNYLFSKNNIRLFGLIPSSTHATQPLDLCFFGLIKPKIESLAAKDTILLTSFNIASYWQKAQTQLIQRSKEVGKSVLQDGFHASGIYPFNPSKSLPKTTYSTSVLQPTPAAVTLAKQAGTAAGKLIAADVQQACAESLAGHVSGASMTFLPLSQKGIAEREKLAGKKKKNPLPLDEAERAKYFMATHSYTSASFAALQGLKLKAVEDAAAAAAAKKAASAEVAQRKAEKEVKRKLLVKRGDKRVLNLKRWFTFTKDLLKYDKKFPGKLGPKVKMVVAAPAVEVKPNDSSKKRKAEEPVTFGPPKKQRI